MPLILGALGGTCQARLGCACVAVSATESLCLDVCTSQVATAVLRTLCNLALVDLGALQVCLATHAASGKRKGSRKLFFLEFFLSGRYPALPRATRLLHLPDSVPCFHSTL
jgi:hypothetical protein